MLPEILKQAGTIMAVVHRDLDASVIVEVGGGYTVAVEREVKDGGAAACDLDNIALRVVAPFLQFWQSDQPVL
ncbi:MAG TPA: hypothetical protein VIX14_15255 [Terriglobales bacterium]